MTLEASGGKNQQLGLPLRRGRKRCAGLIWRCIHSLVWQVMLPVSWDLDRAWAPTLALLWDLDFLTTWQPENLTWSLRVPKLNLHHLSHLVSEITQHHFCSIYWLWSESQASWDSKGKDIYFLMGGMSKKWQPIFKNHPTFFHDSLNTFSDVLSVNLFFGHHFPILSSQAKVRLLCSQAPCFPPLLLLPVAKYTHKQVNIHTHPPQFSGNYLSKQLSVALKIQENCHSPIFFFFFWLQREANHELFTIDIN